MSWSWAAQRARPAPARALETAGISNAANTLMIAITTKSSTSVNARGLCVGFLQEMLV